jgi:hypothetical protein
MSSTQACDQARDATDEVTIYPTYIEERTPSLRINPECSACLEVIRSTCCCPIISPSRRGGGAWWDKATDEDADTPPPLAM